MGRAPLVRHAERKPIEVTWVQPGEDPEAFARAIAAGAVSVRTLGQVLSTYPGQIEHKVS